MPCQDCKTNTIIDSSKIARTGVNLGHLVAIDTVIDSLSIAAHSGDATAFKVLSDLAAKLEADVEIIHNAYDW
jgi:hypothetical protein